MYEKSPYVKNRSETISGFYELLGGGELSKNTKIKTVTIYINDSIFKKPVTGVDDLNVFRSFLNKNLLSGNDSRLLNRNNKRQKIGKFLVETEDDSVAFKLSVLVDQSDVFALEIPDFKGAGGSVLFFQDLLKFSDELTSKKSGLQISR
jgi:hypothetical protein